MVGGVGKGWRMRWWMKRWRWRRSCVAFIQHKCSWVLLQVAARDLCARTRTRTLARVHMLHARARMLTDTHTHAQTRSLTHTCVTHTKTHKHTYAHTNTHTQTHSYTHSLTHSLTDAPANARAHARAHARMQTHAHPTPYNLHPTLGRIGTQNSRNNRYTQLKHLPEALQPKPQFLNPKSSTLNPKP